MIYALVRTHPPTAIDTVEALCDAILRNDVTTQKTLMSMESVPSPISGALGEMKDKHQEVAMSYSSSITKEWDDNNASFARVCVPRESLGKAVCFTCRYVVNQWTIIAIELETITVGTKS